MQITAETIRNMLEAAIESDEPEAVLAVFRKNAGKPLSKRILAQLPGGEERWILGERYGSKVLYDRAYLNQKEGGFSFYLSPTYHATKNLTVDPAVLEDKNACYFSARRERAAKIRAMLADPEALTRLASRVQLAIDARETYTAAIAKIDEIAGYGGPADPVRSQIENLVKF